MDKRTLEKIKRIAESLEWSVYINKMNKEYEFEFSVFTPAGQDFNMVIVCDDSVESFIGKLYDYYDSFDADYEASFWIGDDGHGTKGAPYHIKDIVDDMEQAERMIYELYIRIKESF